MSPLARTLDRFREAVSGPPEEVPLARAALLIAAAEYPSLDVDAYERRLEEMASTLQARPHDDTDEPAALLRTVNDLLFAELGFDGDDGPRDDPASLFLDLFLNDVLDRRRGVPVTLTIVYLELCQRAGIDVHAVGLPGHVVARLIDEQGESVYIDVARGGRLLSADDCRQLVRETYGRRMTFHDHYLSAVTPRQLLQRLLHTLKAHALQQADEERAGRAIELLLAMYPWDLDQLRDRGMLNERLGDYRSALADLEQYVRFRTGARDIDTVSQAVRSLRQHVEPPGRDT